MLKREDSFLHLKQKQWAKEKAEQENRAEWFPFGENLKPGGGSPLRKFVSKEPPLSLKMKKDETIDKSEDNNNNEDDKKMQKTAEEMHSKSSENQKKCENEETEASQNLSQPLMNQPHPFTFAYPIIHPAFAYPYSFSPNFGKDGEGCSSPLSPPPLPSSSAQTSSSQFPWQFGYPSNYQIIPPNAVPVSTINLDPSICPVEQLAAFQNLLGMPQPPPGMRYGIPIPPPSQFINQSMTSSVSSSESGVSGVTSKRENVEQITEKNKKMTEDEKQSTSDYNDDDPPSRKSTGEYKINYEEQIKMRLQFEKEEKEKELKEEEEIRKQQKILEEREKLEHEKKLKIEKKRIEEERRRSQQFIEAFEAEKKKAEQLKKARLYKHVLEGAEEKDELQKKLLGVDQKTAEQLLKEVEKLEHQKMQDSREIQKNAPKHSPTPQKTNTSPKTNSTCSMISNNSPISCSTPTFTRNGYGRRSVRTTSREKNEESRIFDHHQTNDDSKIGVKEMKMTPNVYRTKSKIDKIEKNEEEKQNSKLPVKNSKISIEEKGHKLNGRKNSDEHILQNGLFSQVPTRLSSRRLRNSKMQTASSPQAANLLEREISHHSSSSFEINDEILSSGGSISPDHNHNISTLNSTENIHSKHAFSPGENDLKTPTRSALGSSSQYLNSHGSTSRKAFLENLEQKGAVRREEDCLSPAVRRVAESNLSRTSSVASLGGSFQNLTQLRGSLMNLSVSGETSPSLSKFQSISSARKSLNDRIKHTTERQKLAIERLNKLRESLHSGKNYTPPRVSRLGTNGINQQTSRP